MQDMGGGGNFDLKSISHGETNFAFWRAQKEFFRTRNLLAKNYSNMDENFTRVADSCKLRLTNYPIRSQNHLIRPERRF